MRFWLPILLTSAALLPQASAADLVPVRHLEGLVHGFLVLRTLDGRPIAEGDLTQVSLGERVTNRLVFHFRDGSIHEETAVFTQHADFRLLSDHLIQRGPAFPRPLELSLDAVSGQVTVRRAENGRSPKVSTENLKLPQDVANGLVITLLKNIEPRARPTTVSMVVADPKPRLVKLVISSEGQESFSLGATNREATHYVIEVVLGGVTGWAASLLGKKPPDTHVWMLGGEAPAFVKSEGPLYEGGPIWRTELATPVWPVRRAADSPRR